MDLTYLAAQDWWANWNGHALFVLPQVERKQHVKRMQEFFTWNFTGKVHERRLNEYLDDLAKRSNMWRESLATFNLVWGNEPTYIPLTATKRQPPVREKWNVVAATELQFEFILKDFSKDGADPDRAVFVLLLWECGMAMIDAAKLKWSEVDFDNSIIKADRNKTRTRFRVPIERDGRLYKLLEVLKQDPDREEWVSPTNHIKYQHSRRHFVWQIRQSCRRAGLPKGSVTHAFRRGFVSRLANSGVPATVIAQMSGHIDIGTMCSYFKPTDDDLRQAIERADTRQNQPHQPAHVPLARTPQGKQAPAHDWVGDCDGERIIQADG